MPTTQKSMQSHAQQNTGVGDIFVTKYDQLLRWALHLTSFLPGESPMP